MNRRLSFALCAICGLALVLCGLSVPAHLKAVDHAILQRAGLNTPTLTDEGLQWLQQQKPGPARMLLLVARDQRTNGRDKLEKALTLVETVYPTRKLWGSAEPQLDALFSATGATPEPGGGFTEFIIRQTNRAKAIQYLSSSTKPVVRALVQTRTLTNTVLFSPSGSSSGQAFDAGIALCGLLLERGQLTPALSDALYHAILEALNGGSTVALEQALLDLLSLGQRFNWGQMAAFLGQIEAADTLRLLANLAQSHEDQIPVLFSAVCVSERPGAVAAYLAGYGARGMHDVAISLGLGSGATRELLARDQRVSQQTLGPMLGLDFATKTPALALALKWAMLFAGGFLLASAAHFARPMAADLMRPLQVRGFHIAREFLFALGFLLVVLLFTEPFLSQDRQRMEFPLRLQLPRITSAATAAIAHPSPKFMNQSLLTLLLFFVLQGLIYTACLLKLGEIRRQRVAPKLKLKLLENEEHLFDAGLYLGFAGTIVSLILVSVGIIQQSLMAAYSSTSFGIIFVSAFKIFNLRPARRNLLLEAETYLDDSEEPVIQTRQQGTA